MTKLSLLAFALCLAACATAPTETSSRTPSSHADLSGKYLGEGLFDKRDSGVRRPAIRFYLDRSQTENDTYYGVLVEYPNLLKMTPQYLATQKVPALNKLIGYLSEISTRISAYKLVPGQQAGTYQMHNLEVRDGQIVPERDFTMTLHLNPMNGTNPLFGASIKGNEDGQINFPTPKEVGIKDLLTFSQYELATLVYKRATYRRHGAGTGRIWKGPISPSTAA
jgi:hypothetical protein